MQLHCHFSTSSCIMAALTSDYGDSLSWTLWYRVGDCGLLAQCLDSLAAQYPGTKFVKIISTDCIPKYPDQNLPTVLLYHNTQLKQHLVGLPLYGGRHTTPEGEAHVGSSDEMRHCLACNV